jgi:bifunctional non-homologous end joining protein LigD
MLAKAATREFNPADYFVEPKYDGIRCIAYNNQLINRSMVNITLRFPEISQPHHAVIDGELVCFSPAGIPDFQLIQRRMNRQFDIAEQARLYPATFVAFDLLALDNKPLINEPLWKRKRLLAALESGITVAPYLDTYSEAYVAHLVSNGWEGAMAKRAQSIYKPGSRTNEWLKIKLRKEIVIDVHGLTPGTGHRASTFGAMIGALAGNHVGDVGTGFTDDEAADMLDIFQQCQVETPTLPFYKGPVLMWLAPVIKIKVSYIEITNAGQLRHPSFVRLANI